MASSKRSFHLFSLLLATTAALSSACARLDLNYDRSNSVPVVDSGAGGSTSTGAAGTGAQDAGDISLPPQEHPFDGTPTFMNLCGGGCMTSDVSIGCSTAMNPENETSISCQIVPTEDGASAECLPAGTSKIGEACERAADCAASLGCVLKDSGVGVCRPYCCADIEACEVGTYCAPATMTEDAASALPLQIPVCTPTTPCKLLDDKTCTDGLTCTLVRTNGTTDCVTPGTGKLGEACPCAANHVCQIATQKCLALCHTDGSDCPDGMLCQGGAKGFPSGIGVCVQ
jgi:hypothetical protein